jgi:hypothetical protein
MTTIFNFRQYRSKVQFSRYYLRKNFNSRELCSTFNTNLLRPSAPIRLYPRYFPAGDVDTYSFRNHQTSCYDSRPCSVPLRLLKQYRTIFAIANGCIAKQFSFHRKHHGTSGGIITCSHASTCLHVVFFGLNVYFFKIDKKGGHPPLFLIRNEFRQKKRVGQEVWDRFSGFKYLGIWTFRHLEQLQ